MHVAHAASFGPLAQLVRAPRCRRGGQGSESPMDRLKGKFNPGECQGVATKKVAKKAEPKAPKAPADKFIVVRDSCQNVISEQLQTKADATKRARDEARDCQDAHTIYKVVGVQRLTVPSAIIVEDL